jgi:hypothetical protein
MRGELLRFSNKSDFYCGSQMVLPGGSDISNGEGFEKQKKQFSISFSSPKGLCKETCGI